LSHFEILNPGFLTTYQDLGRPDMLKFALPHCGAMDETSLRLANLLKSQVQLLDKAREALGDGSGSEKG
jgi:hypothetical protein